MACPQFKLGVGSVLYVAATDVAAEVVTVNAAAAVGDTTIDLTGTSATLEAGDLLSFGDDAVVKVTASHTLSATPETVSCKPLDAAFAGTETANFRDMLIYAGLEEITFGANREEIEVTTIASWEVKEYIAGLMDQQINSGTVKVIAGNAAQELVRSNHYQNQAGCLFWRIVARNGAVINGEGFTKDDLPLTITSTDPIMSAISIRLNGGITQENLW